MADAHATRRFHLLIVLFLLVLGAAYGLSIRSGADWTEDYALYLRHAMNLADGLPYGQDGVPDLDTGRVVSYPVGYPLVLAAAYAAFGLDFQAFAWINIAFLVLFAALLMAYARRYRAPSDLLAVLLAAACMANPIVWEAKDDILSDALFLLLSSLVLFLYEDLRCAPRPDGWARRAAQGVLALAIVAAYATRAVGLVLPIAILVFEALRYRRIHAGTALVLVPFAGYFVLQQLLLEDSFAGYVRDATVAGVAPLVDPWRWLAKANNYRWMVAGFFGTERYPLFDNVLFYGLIAVPAAVGYAARLVRGLTVLEVYAAGYLALLMVARTGNYERYLVPLFVLLLIYAVEGLAILSARFRADPRYAGSVVLALLLGAYAVKYAATPYDRSAEGIDAASARALFEWVERETGADAVLAAQKAYSLRLMTGRRAGQFPRCHEPKGCLMRDGDRIWDYLKHIGASYVVLKKTDWTRTHYLSDVVFRGVFIEPNREYLSPVYDNPDFEVLRIVRFPAGS